MAQAHYHVVGPGQVVEVEGPALVLPPVGVTLQEIPLQGQHQDAQRHTLATPRLRLQSVPSPSDAGPAENST